MMEICDSALVKPLSISIIFRNCVRTGTFPHYGRNLMVYMFIKNNKQHINNYQPVLLLPIFGKVKNNI